MKTIVDYDVIEQGYLVPYSRFFDCWDDALYFVRRLNAKAITKPIIYLKDELNSNDTSD